MPAIDKNDMLIVSKSVIKEKKKQKKNSDPTSIILNTESKPKPPRKPLTDKQLQQRKKAAQSRSERSQKQKRKDKFLEEIAKKFDEDEEGLKRRYNENNAPSQIIVQEEPMQLTPASAELPAESGHENNPTMQYNDQAYSLNETEKVVLNKKVTPNDGLGNNIHPLEYYQGHDRQIRNPVINAVLDQGIVFEIPQYHKSSHVSTFY